MGELQVRLNSVLQDDMLTEDDKLITDALIQQKIQSLQADINVQCRTTSMV